MPRFSADQLRKVSVAMFRAAGAADDVAGRVSEALVSSNLMGFDSHGVVHIPEYVGWIREGQIDPHDNLEVVKETASTALIDGHWGFGQVVAAKGMRIAIEKAQKCQISLVAIFNCNHIGRVGEYPMMAAERGMVGVVLANAGPVEVAPYGGVERVFDTNPISVAVPAGEMNPFLMDYATSACAEGKLRVARNRGERVPEGWILDKDGQPSTDPNDFYEGGVILPFGGHKGYALNLLIDLLGGALAGAGCACTPQYQGGNGVLMMAIDIEAFRSLEEFKADADCLFARVKAVKPAAGVKEILIPGEPDFRAREARTREGILVEDRTWEEIAGLAKELGIDVDRLL